MTDDLIPAATILLLRDAPAFEVLMIERHADISFAGGALVFPGGKIEASDQDPSWAEYADGYDAAPAAERGPRIAAIREAFEESGVLLARDGEGAMIDDETTAAIDRWRADVEADDTLFMRMVAECELRLACDNLHLFARWQPSRLVTHRRYHTWFFAAQAPDNQTAREDGNEATEALWTSPSAALAARDDGVRRMIFPTSRNVELLDVSASVREVFENAHRRKIEAIEPALIERDGRMLVTIPDGLGYPVTEEPLETAFRS